MPQQTISLYDLSTVRHRKWQTIRQGQRCLSQDISSGRPRSTGIHILPRMDIPRPCPYNPVHFQMSSKAIRFNQHRHDLGYATTPFGNLLATHIWIRRRSLGDTSGNETEQYTRKIGHPSSGVAHCFINECRVLSHGYWKVKRRQISPGLIRSGL